MLRKYLAIEEYSQAMHWTEPTPTRLYDIARARIAAHRKMVPFYNGIVRFGA